MKIVFRFWKLCLINAKPHPRPIELKCVTEVTVVSYLGPQLEIFTRAISAATEILDCYCP